MSDIAREFEIKYPVPGGSWFMVNSSFTCGGCGDDVYSGEAALNDGIKEVCTRCGIDTFNKLPAKEVHVEPPKVEAPAPYVEEDAAWMMVSGNECYFCGPLTKKCKHFERIQ